MIGLSSYHVITLPQRHSDFASLVLGGTLRHVAMTLLSIFSPIFIYNITSSLSLTLGFYILMLVFKMASLLWAENLSQRFGFKGVIRLSGIPFALFIVSLILSGQNPLFLVPAALFWGFDSGLFWWGYHGYFIKSARDHFGLKLGEADMVQTIAAVATPVLGAFVAAFFGFNALFALAFVFLILSLLVLGKKNDKHQKTDVSIKDTLSLVLKHKAVSFAYFGGGGELHLYLVVWPLFVFFVFGSVLDLGIIVSAAALLSAAFSIFIGKMVDRRGEKWAIKLGAPLMAFSWGARLVVSLPVFIFADSIRHFSQKLVGVPLTELSYKKAVESSTGTAMLFREIGLVFGAITALTIVIMFISLNLSLSTAFIVALVFSLMPLLAVVKNKI